MLRNISRAIPVSKLIGSSIRRVPLRAFRVELEKVGQPETTDFRLFFKNKDGQKISPWHDIPLIAQKHKSILNYVNEIPKGTTAKMEISTKQELNPIAQDIKKGALRFFKYGNIPFNYGCLPQTYEDPKHKHPDTGLVGDNDPLDVCEIGGKPLDMGSVTEIRILGIMALLDEGETDWKVIAINAAAPIPTENELQAQVDVIRDWFINYKVPDGKPQNKFGFDGRLLGWDYASKIIVENHGSWKALVQGKLEAGKLWVPKAK